ncbi:MAG TPA: hypothetical protein VMZ71_16040 [Gemmataceae bacterium]|nr:hypothetical protein [Gemmataceae bacterium]
MNRFVRAASAAAVLGFGALGCTHSRGAGDCPTAGGGAAGKTCGDRYRDLVDPSWPERYNSVARQEVVAPFATQVNNGHVLNQTLYNWHFETGTDALNPAGVQKLASLAKTRPGLDPRLYIQTARDLPMTAESLPHLAAHRTELDARRAVMVQKFMAAQPGAPAVEVSIHDPVVPGIEAQFGGAAYRGMVNGYRGGLTGAAGVSTLGTAAAPLTTVNVTTPSATPGSGGSSSGGSSGGSTGGGNN